MNFNALILVIIYSSGSIAVESSTSRPCVRNSSKCNDEEFGTTTTKMPLATCHLLCHNKNCQTLCRTSLHSVGADAIRRRHQNIRRKFARRKERPDELESEPFEAKGNPFAYPHTTVAPRLEVTPLTISEAELEEELKNLGRTPFPRKHRDEQNYEDESSEDGGDDLNFQPESPANISPGDNNFTEPTTSLSTATPNFPTLLPETTLEPFPPPRTSQSLPSRPTNSQTFPPLPPAPPNIQPPSEQPQTSTNIQPPGFSPEPPGFAPDSTSTSTTSTKNCEDPARENGGTLTSSFTKVPQKKKKKLVVTFSTEDFEEIEEGGDDDENDYNSKERENGKKIKKWKVKRPVKSWSLNPAPRFTTPRPPKNIPTLRNGCPPPEICGRNCGIFIDENGCQGCQCLWISNPCSTNIDCRSENQYCDLGRCDCVEGFEYDERSSGVCKPSQSPRVVQKRREFIQNGIRISSSAKNLISGRSVKTLPEERSNLRKIYNFLPLGGRRVRRDTIQKILRQNFTHDVNGVKTFVPEGKNFSTTSSKIDVVGALPSRAALLESAGITFSEAELNDTSAGGKNFSLLRNESGPHLLEVVDSWMPGKPLREERLQWPGPCERDEDCPTNLYCIQSDCWAIPDKPLPAPSHTENLKLPKPNLLKTTNVDVKDRVIWTTTNSPTTVSLSTTVKSMNLPKGPPVNVLFPLGSNFLSKIKSEDARPPSQTPPTVTTKAPEKIADEMEKTAQKLKMSEKTVTNKFGSVKNKKPQKDDPNLKMDNQNDFHEKLFPAERKKNEDEKREFRPISNLQINIDEILDPFQNPSANLSNTNNENLAIHKKFEDYESPVNGSVDFSHKNYPNEDAKSENKVNEVSIERSKAEKIGPRRFASMQYTQQNGKNNPHLLQQPQNTSKQNLKTSQKNLATVLSTNGERLKKDENFKRENNMKKIDPRRKSMKIFEKETRKLESNTISATVATVFPRTTTKRTYTVNEFSSRLKLSTTTIIPHLSSLNSPPNSKTKTRSTNIRRRIFYDYSMRNRIRKPVRVEIKNAKSVIRDECTVHADCSGVGAANPQNAQITVSKSKSNNHNPAFGNHDAVTNRAGRAASLLLCCEKRWCDLSAECGKARFCLPDCRLTKMTHLAWAGVREMPLLDLIYD